MESAIPSTSSTSKLQQSVMDFSDRYVTAIWSALDLYIAAEPEVAKQVQAQRLKVALATASMNIAASRDPRASLLDMEIFVSAGKWAMDRYWIPQVLGERASGLRGVYDEMEEEIRVEVDQVLTSAQRADLRSLIAAWKQSNPSAREVMDVRLRNLEGVVLRDFEDASSGRGLLASVRRLLGNVDQSLLYGERIMFFIERTPLVLAQQADLTVDRVAERFPIATVNPDFAQWGRVASGLPQQIGEMLQQRELVIRELLPEVRASLESFERITSSVQGTIVSADSLAAKVQALPLAREDYHAALERTGTSLEKLNRVVEGLNQLLEEDGTDSGSSRVVRLAQVLDERAERAMNAIFLRAAALIGLAIAGLLVVLVFASVLFRRSAAVEKQT